MTELLYQIKPKETFEAEGRIFKEGQLYPVYKKDEEYVILHAENGSFNFSNKLMDQVVASWGVKVVDKDVEQVVEESTQKRSELFTFELVDGYTIEGFYPKFGNSLFKIILQDGDHYGELITSHGGNVYGASLIESVVDSIEDGYLTINKEFEENKKHAITDDDDLLVGVYLFDEAGEELMLLETEDFIHSIVGIVMIKYEVEKR